MGCYNICVDGWLMRGREDRDVGSLIALGWTAP